MVVVAVAIVVVGIVEVVAWIVVVVFIMVVGTMVVSWVVVVMTPPDVQPLMKTETISKHATNAYKASFAMIMVAANKLKGWWIGGCCYINP